MQSADARDNQATWGVERRLEFIDFRLRWQRTVNRSDLIGFFRISPQQASADLARYAELAPGNLAYDKSLKTYRATAAFKPVTARHHAQSYLDELMALSSDLVAPADSFIGWQPACEIVRYPVRAVSTETLLAIVWAIRDSEEIKISYQSLRRSSSALRWIAPHALAFDSHRWHVRAWCHEDGEFKDFVISRIQRVHGHRRTNVSSAHDEGWHARVNIVVAPRTGLTDGQRRAIETEFGMSRGRLKLSCRKALAFYLLRQLQLDSAFPQPPATQPLELVNRAELADVIAAAQKAPEFAPSPHIRQRELHHERT